MITLRAILDYIHSGSTFSCKVVTYDAQRQRGGTILHIHEAQLLRTDPSHRPTAQQLAEAYKREALDGPRPTRAPQHRQHFTRNLRIFQQGLATPIIQKIHPPLIIEFNGDPDVVV